MDSKQLAEKIKEILEDNKAKEVTIMDVAEKTVIAEYFVICTGTSTLQVKGFAKDLDDELSKIGVEYRHREGFIEGRWIAMDYGDVVVHIFHQEARGYYNLEKLWEKAGSLENLNSVLEEETEDENQN